MFPLSGRNSGKVGSYLGPPTRYQYNAIHLRTQFIDLCSFEVHGNRHTLSNLVMVRNELNEFASMQ